MWRPRQVRTESAVGRESSDRVKFKRAVQDRRTVEAALRGLPACRISRPSSLKIRHATSTALPALPCFHRHTPRPPTCTSLRGG